MHAAINFRADHTKGKIMNVQLRQRLLATTLLFGAAAYAGPAFAQDPAPGEVPVAPVNEPVIGDTPAQAVDQSAPATDQPGEEIVVTGSRIARPNLTSNSPIAVVTGEETVENADITLDTFLNTLPQVNPAGTTTSNNPGNGGQSNIDLRGLGANRNLVLVDGRRPMPSGTNMAVDLNTLPQGLIERIEIITGGAGATYGADAISGVVNIRLKDDFQGVELRATYADAMPEFDAREYQVSGHHRRQLRRRPRQRHLLGRSFEPRRPRQGRASLLGPGNVDHRHSADRPLCRQRHQCADRRRRSTQSLRVTVFPSAGAPKR